jgi:hypothetical protein
LKKKQCQNLDEVLLKYLSNNMDEKQFLERLSEVAHWERPKISAPDPRRPKRGRRSAEEIEEEENELAMIGEEIQTGPNDTVPPVLTKIKPIAKICEDCGIMAQNRRVEIRKSSYPVEHFRHHCKACGLTKSPITGRFELKQGVELQNIFKKYWYNKLKD